MARFVFPRSILVSLGLCLSLAFASAAYPQGAEPKPEQLYKQTLPSVMTLKVELKPGGTATGTAFLALKDGMAVTCWHVIRDAKRVTAKFADGEEFEVSGLVDRDEKRDLALIRVKVAGRPLLNLSTSDPLVGSRAYAIGAPRGFDFSITDGLVSQVRTEKGRKEIQISCPVSPGNSGGPVIGVEGKVLGVVSYLRVDGQNLNFAISSVYAAAFDTTLSTQPWDTVKPTVVELPDGSSPDPVLVEPAVLDPLLATSLLDFWDLHTAYQFVISNITRTSGGYEEGVPVFVYSLRREGLATIDRLARAKSADPEREQLRTQILKGLIAVREALDWQSQAVLMAQRRRGWDSDSNDLSRRAQAALNIRDGLTVATIKGLIARSAEFRKAMSGNGHSSLHNDPEFHAGFTHWQRRSLIVLTIYKDSITDELGLKSYDEIVSVDDQHPANLAEFRKLLVAKLGSRVSLVVKRGGKQVTLEKKLPKQLPKGHKPSFFVDPPAG